MGWSDCGNRSESPTSRGTTVPRHVSHETARGRSGPSGVLWHDMNSLRRRPTRKEREREVHRARVKTRYEDNDRRFANDAFRAHSLVFC